MPVRIACRAALAALLLALTIAGIGAAGPAVAMHAPSRHAVFVAGGALEVMLAGLLIALRWRAAPAAGVGARLRGILSGALVTGLFVVPVAMVLATAAPIRWRRRTVMRVHGARGRPARAHGARAVSHVADLGVLHDVLIGLVIAALLVAAVLIWRSRRLTRLARRGALLDEDTGTPDDPAHAARAIDSGRQAMRDLDDARAAIIACYAAMEASLAEAGAAREIAETPDELLARVAGMVNAAAAASLTALFYEARFSTHPMSAERRYAAEQALAELAETLPAPGVEPAATGQGRHAGAAGEGR
jgi:uncharacterized protein DUF4129